MSYPDKTTASLHLYLGSVAATASIDADSTALTADAGFTAADVGAPIWLLGAGADGGNLFTTVAAVTDATHCTITDPAITALPDPTYSAVILFRETGALAGTITYNGILFGQDTLSVTTDSLPAARPNVGQPVLLADDDEGEIFGGSIDHAKTSNIPGAQIVRTEIDCVSWDALASKRLTQRSYSGQSAGDIFVDLVTRDLAADHVSAVADDPGPTIDAIAFDWEPVASAADKLVKASNSDTDTYFVWSSPRRVLHFSKQTTSPAPWSISDEDGSDGNVLAQVSADRSRDKFANRVFVRSAKQLGTDITEEYPGDGTSREFVAAGVITLEPTISITTASPSQTLEQTVGVYGVDSGKDWYYTPGSASVIQDDAGTVLTENDSISITYRPISEGISLYQNSTAVDDRAAAEGGTGYYETAVTISTPTTETAMSALAEALAKKSGKLVTAVEIRTFRGGLRAGQLITIHLDDIGVDDDYLIDSVTMSANANNYAEWTAHAVLDRFVGDYRKALADLASGGEMGLALASGGGGSYTRPGEDTGGGGETGELPDDVTITGATYEYTAPDFFRWRWIVVTLTYETPADWTGRGVHLYFEAPDGTDIHDGGLSFATGGVSGEIAIFKYAPPTEAETWRIYANPVGPGNVEGPLVLHGESGETPNITLAIDPPAAIPGEEQCGNVTIDADLSGVEYWYDSNGAYWATIRIYFTPPDDARWAGVNVYRGANTDDPKATGYANSPIVWDVAVPKTLQDWDLYVVSYDTAGIENTIELGVTAMITVAIGAEAGTFDITCYDPATTSTLTVVDGKLTVLTGGALVVNPDGSLDVGAGGINDDHIDRTGPNRLLIVTGDLAADSVLANNIISGAVSTRHLDTTGLDVGGGGGKAGLIRCYNSSAVLIGMMGDYCYDGVNHWYGMWSKIGRFGGAAFGTPKMLFDDTGLAILDGTIALQRTENPGTGNEQSYRAEINSAWDCGYGAGATFTGLQVWRLSATTHKALLINRGLVAMSPSGYQAAALVSYNGDPLGGNGGTFYGIMTIYNGAGVVTVSATGSTGRVQALMFGCSGYDGLGNDSMPIIIGPVNVYLSNGTLVGSNYYVQIRGGICTTYSSVNHV